MKKMLVLVSMLFSLANIANAEQENNWPLPTNKGILKASMVSVLKTNNDPKDAFFCLSSSAFNFFYGVRLKPNLIATAKHNCRGFQSFLHNGHPLEILKASEDSDLILLKANGMDPEDCQPIELETKPRIGFPVFTFVETGGKNFWKRAGLVSSVSQEEILLKHYVPRPGESGKPVFTHDGKLLGLVSGYRFDRQTRKPLQGILVPAKKIKNLLDQ